MSRHTFCMVAVNVAFAAALCAGCAQSTPQSTQQTPSIEGSASPSRAASSAPLDAALQSYEQGDLAAAERGFRALAEKQLPVAQFNLAMMHLREELHPADPAVAVTLLERAAAGGFVSAEYALGQVYELGLLGDRRDLTAANRWYTAASLHGHVDAQVALATAYFLGRGVGKDFKEAAHWYREAAKGGDVGAQYILASMYEHGDGVTTDLRLARYWYDIAARNGDEAAPGKRDEIDALMRGS